MKRLVLLTCIFALSSATLAAQEERSSVYSITFKNKKGTSMTQAASALFFGRSFAEVWSATVKMLIMDEKLLVMADRTGGVIFAKLVNFDVWFQFFIEDAGDGANVFFTVKGKGWAIQQICNEMCQGIAEQLPPKVE